MARIKDPELERRRREQIMSTTRELLTSGGYGKRTKMEQFPLQKRGGMGVKAIKLTRVRGSLVGGRAITKGSEIFVISTDGIVIRTAVDSISRQKRDASGVKVMDLPDGAELAAFALVPPDDTPS